MELKSGVYGRYRLTVRRDEEVIEQTPWFDNLIVNNGLDLLGTNTFNQCITYCYVGTDSTAPAATDTFLGAQIAATNSNGPGVSNTSNTSGSPYYFGYKYVKRFAKGDAAGNLTEVGVGTDAAGNDLFSHALILDGAGNPTTLTLTSIDVLDVEYEFRVYVEEGDVSWSETVNATPYSGVIRAAEVGLLRNIGVLNPGDGSLWSGGISSITGRPSGGSSEVGIESVQVYTAGNYYRDVKLSLTTAQGNFGGIQSALIGWHNSNAASSNSPKFQMSFSPAIPKDNTKTFEFTLRYTWARYTPP